MITMTLTPARLSKHGATTGQPAPDVATTAWGGQKYSAQTANGASMAVARQLVAAGCPDQPWECRNAAHQRTIFGRSLHALAKLTVTHGNTGPRFVAYREYPGAA